MNRGACWAAVLGVPKSRTRLKRLSMHACIGEGNGNQIQYSCLENPRDGGAWWAALYGVAQSRTQLKQLSSSSSSTFQLYNILIWTVVTMMIFDDQWRWTSFQYLLVICVSSLKKISLDTLHIIWIGLFCFVCYWVIWIPCIFYISTLCQIYDLEIFSPIPLVTFPFCLWFVVSFAT